MAGQHIGEMNEVAALADTDMLEIERPDGDPGAEPPVPNSWWRVPALKIASFVLAKIVRGSGLRLTLVGGQLTLASGGVEVADVTASATLALSHADRFLRCNSATAMTVTIPPQSTVAWADETQIEGAQWGAGQVTFAPGAGVTIRAHADFGLKTKGQYSPFTLKRVAENEWLLCGHLGAP